MAAWRNGLYLFLMFNLVWCTGNLNAQTTPVYDVIELSNGTKLKGEFKKMTYGEVLFDEDVIGDIKVDLVDISRIKALQGLYEVEMVDGRYYLGILDSFSIERQLIVRSIAGKVDSLHFDNIYSIYKLEKSFWKRFYGYFALGGSYTKSSGIGRVDLNSDINYRQTKSLISLNSYLTLTTNDNGENTQRTGVSGSYFRLLKNKIRAGGLLNYERNTELGFKGRVNVAGIIGTNFSKKYFTEFFVATGLNTRKEWDLDGNSSPLNVDFPIHLSFQLFDSGNQDVSFYIKNTFFQQIGSNRQRNNLDLSISWEIIGDLDLLLTNYLNYDSRPTTENASETDWGFTISIKYGF